jgi:ABC-2 type transport system ATP-binding protein
VRGSSFGNRGEAAIQGNRPQPACLRLGNQEARRVAADIDARGQRAGQRRILSRSRNRGSHAPWLGDAPSPRARGWHYPAVSGNGVAIEVRGLRKRYGELEAVRGIDFEVARGEVFGLLGPNGAGKTTTVEILEGYRERSEGHVSVLGHDPQRRERALRERVGIVLQSSGIYGQITVREALEHWASFYPRPRDVDEVLGLAGLRDKQGERARRLSGGQRRRLDFALALVGDPELIFLDEPTTGFDPAARRNAWDTVRSLKGLGKTILLTTHYLDEAQALADRVAIVKDGAILAEGAPRDLAGGATGAVYMVSWRDGAGERHARETRDPTTLLHELTGAALERGERLDDLHVTRPTLEDIYMDLTADG